MRVRATENRPAQHPFNQCFRSLPRFKGQRCLHRVRNLTRLGVSNAYFTLPNHLLQPDHLSPVRGESESSRSRNCTHINTLAFHHLQNYVSMYLLAGCARWCRGGTYVFKTWKDKEERKDEAEISSYTQDERGSGRTAPHAKTALTLNCNFKTYEYLLLSY